MNPIECPNSAGFWMNIEDGMILEVYELEPVMNTLCIWGPDIGITWTGVKDTNSIWITDEWQGHIPVHLYCENYGPWLKKDIIDEIT